VLQPLRDPLKLFTDQVTVGPSYIIFKDDAGRVYAKNGRTGQIEFSGTDAATVIQQAIDALPSGGGKIFIKAGEYQLTKKINLKSNLTIEGEGFGTVFYVMANIYEAISGIQVENVVLCGLRLNGMYPTFKKIRWYGFYFEKSRNIIIKGCWSSNFRYGGIAIDTCSDVIVQSCILTDCREPILYVYGSERVTIADCIFLHTDSFPYISTAIYLWESRRVSVVNNLIAPYGADLSQLPILGIIADTCDELTILGNILWYVVDGFHVYAPVSRVIFAFNYVKLNPYIGPAGTVDLFGATDCIVVGNIVPSIDEGKDQEEKGDRNIIMLNYVEEGYIGKAGASTIVRYNFGYVTENGGVATFSGDGSTTQFKIPHGLASTPTVVSLEAKSVDAAGDKYWTADETYIYVNFVTAPPAGTDNVVISWKAEV